MRIKRLAGLDVWPDIGCGNVILSAPLFFTQVTAVLLHKNLSSGAGSIKAAF